MKTIGFALIALTSVSTVGASPWSRLYSHNPGTGSVFSVERTADGRIFLIELGSPAGVRILALDADGNGLWETGFTGEDRRIPDASTPTADGGLALVVNIGLGQTTDPVLVRLDSSGTPLWVRQLETPGEQYLLDLVEVPGGDLVAVGTYRDPIEFGQAAWVVRTSASGDLEWSRRFMGDSGEL